MKKMLRLLLLSAALAVMLSVGAFAAGERGLYDAKKSDAAPEEAALTFKYFAGTGETTGDGIAASSLDAPSTSDFHNGSERLAVTYSNTGKVAADKQYLVLVTNTAITAGNTLTETMIEYIDQVTSTANTVAFTVYQKSYKTGGPYHIYLASNDDTEGALTSLTEIATYEYYAAYRLGDVDGNNRIAARDALWVLQAVSTSRTLNETQRLAGDVDKNGRIAARDALWILQAVSTSRILEN